jgi:putative ABC transport system permease protein
MKIKDLLLTASANMFRSKARTFLTIVAIFIGAMTITLTNGIGTGVKSYVNQQVGSLGATNVLIVELSGPKHRRVSTSGPTKYTYNPGATVASAGPGGQTQLNMNDTDINKLETVSNITQVVPALSPTPDYIQGKSDKYLITVSQQIGDSTGQMLAGHSVDGTTNVNQISLPKSYVQALGYSSYQSIIGNQVKIGITNALGKQSIVTAVVVGVQQKDLLGSSTATTNNALSTDLNTVQNQGIPKALADTFQTAYANFPSSLTTAQINQLKSTLSAEGFTAKTIKDEQNTIFAAINAIIIVFDLFGAIALLAASFGIINTLFMSVQERTKEIGLMKALGMSKRKIFLLFSIEAILIGFWGSLLGVGFAALIGTVINSIGKNGFLKNFPGLNLLTFPLSTVIVVIVGIMLIAFLAGSLPALRASRKDPIEALRYE